MTNRWRQEGQDPEDAIPLQLLPTGALKGEMVEVIMAAVRGPHKFYLHLRSQHGDLMAMMGALDAEMEERFRQEPTDPALPPPQVGRLVAARWQPDERWYRARVLALTSQTSVRLLYIDYGDVVEVEWWKARQLPASFRRLPVQAIPARLAGARPPAGGWGRAAARALLRLAGNSEERGLLAVVGSGGGDTLPVWLVDTVGNDVPEGLWLHESLVVEGLAEFQMAEEVGLEAVVRPRVRALVREAVALAGQLAGGREEGEILRRRVLDVETRVRNLEGVVYSDDRKPDGVEEPAAEVWTVEKRVKAGPGGQVLAVVRGGGRAWVPAGAASGLVPEWRGWDLLEARLAARGLRPEGRRLARADTQGWEPLEAAGLVCAGQAELLLYRLDTLPPALTTISCPAAAVLTAVWNNIKENF